MAAGRPPSRPRGRRQPDPDLIARLRELPPGPTPDPGFRAELRRQLVSITPRLVAESDAEPAETTPRRRRGFVAARRPLVAFAGASCVLVLLLGLVVHLSGGALPGQSLYGLKRASEDFRLSVSGSDADKGLRYLKLATSRARESGDLVGTTPASVHTAALVASTLHSADSETRSGMRLLGGAAVGDMSAEPLAPVAGWVTAQRAQITALLPRLTAGTAARRQASASLTLLGQVATRAAQLTRLMGCSCLSRADSDSLGPKPCTSCRQLAPSSTPAPTRVPTLPAPSGLPLPTTAPTAGTSTSQATSSDSSGGSAGPAGGSTSAGSAGSSGALPGLPTVSRPAPSGAPGTSVSLPGLGSIGIGPSGATISLAPTLP